MELADPSDGEDDSITAAIDVSLTTGDSVKASEVVTAPSTNGHAEDGAASVTDPADEGASGSRIATPQPITPGDAGEPGSSTN